MDIDNDAAPSQHHVAKQSDKPLTDLHHDLSPHVWENASPLPWTTREPFSPLTMGFPLPYLDVLTVQSKRLLPRSRKELETAIRRQPLGSHARRVDSDRPDMDDDGSATATAAETHEDGESEGTKSGTDHDGRPASLDVDTLLQSVRLLVEPLALPDLAHTGVQYQFASATSTSDATPPPQFCVAIPTHRMDETPHQLFYPTGAKNANMREYIKDTIYKHMAGLLTDQGPNSSPSKSSQAFNGYQSMPTLQAAEGGASPTHYKKTVKAKHKRGDTKLSNSGSPAKTSSSLKRHGVSSGARLSGAVSTSGLLNPELTRQTKDILAQLRANANKINDLIGS